MPPTTDELNEALKVVIDPEIGINVVDLGLIYEIDVTEDGEVTITYSLTSMGCPLGPIIDQDIRDALTGMEGITSVTNNLVMTPPWGPDRMSEFAKSALGFF